MGEQVNNIEKELKMAAESKKKNSEKGSTYCRPEKKGVGKLQKTSNKYCPVCKKKIRGPHHAEGTHHRGISIQKY